MNRDSRSRLVTIVLIRNKLEYSVDGGVVVDTSDDRNRGRVYTSSSSFASTIAGGGGKSNAFNMYNRE